MTTVIFPASGAPPTLPGLKIEESTAKPSPQPVPSGNQTAPARSQSGLRASQSVPSTANDSHRLLSQDEWVQFCRGVGVFKDDESETVIRPTCWYWPAKGFPDGLYQDVLWERAKFSYRFHVLSMTRWILMIVQLALSAVLTALGSTSMHDGTFITVIAGVNTCLAGVLALMHNSGLPDRYRSDRNEYYKVEEYLKEIIDTRLVPVDNNVTEVMAACFEKFQAARQTVQQNIPASYTPSAVTSPAPLKSKQNITAKN